MLKKIGVCMMAFFMITTAYGQEDGNYEYSGFFSKMAGDDKAAILMVHFGTTHDDTRGKTIDRLNNKVKELFPNVEVREAYTSRIVMKRLGDRGIVKQNPEEALKQLHAEGYTHILIQSSTVINGVEMESLYRNVDRIQNLFKEIRTGNPLLYSPHDYEKVIEALTIGNNNETAYVWVGHGTYDATTAQYAMLDYMLKDKGYANYFVGTIEGYPGYDNVSAQLKSSGLKKVTLIPFMFVAGEHAKNDIAKEWANDLRNEGFQVDVEMKGLGENPQIQDIYIAHLQFLTHHRKIGILEKKALYEKTGEKHSH